jgi:hypothetical protein
MNQAGHEELITKILEAIPLYDLVPSKFSGVKVSLLDQQKDRIAFSCEESDIICHFNGPGSRLERPRPVDEADQTPAATQYQ